MTVEVRCFRIYENERGFDEYERYYDFDGEFETYEEAINWMHKACGNTSGEQAFVFDVEVVGMGWN